MPAAKRDVTTGGRVVAVLFVACFAVVVLRSAWMHDDAYITFRTVDNFVNGYGLRWNTIDRVQTYTHPLWMFVVSAGYSITREVFFTVLAISAVLSVSTVLLIVFDVAATVALGCLAVAALTFSKAFVDYSTSGLENPLTHFLLVIFLALLFRRAPSLTTLFLLALVAGLAAVNRLDTVLLYAPVLLLLTIDAGGWRAVAVAGAGFLPLVFWEAFSLLYYGFPFPNTAYAKLFAAGISGRELVRHGLYYLANSARLDPLTLLLIAGGIVAGLWARDRVHGAVAAGVVAYLAYVVCIGGDFVTGRFLGAPLLAAVILLARLIPPSRTVLAVGGAVVLAVGLSSSDPPPLSTSGAGSHGKTLMDAHGIADERAYYYPYSGLLRALQGVTVASHPWAVEGQAARQRRVPLAFRGDIGYYGYYAGPQVHIVDVWGLADPLIARLPARTDVGWRVGHFTRAMPDGYPETLASGRNHIVDRKTAELYDQLSLITRSPLFDPKRLAAIWKMNSWPT
ncbi:MAG TPA: hypothetical protein VM032_08700 [Vicinamibacterales bacterium]|nr:hypothetical protein [Vicinamibacterales bacterium]